MLNTKGHQQDFSLQPSSSLCFRRRFFEVHQACPSGRHQDELGSQANARLPGIEAHMRSELVYLAGLKIENRFLLSATVIRAVRMLHINSSRTEDTVNRVFAEVAQGRYIDVKLPKIAPPPVIEALVVPLA
jgi:hypothetical protein